jgi:hypothetical protein
VGTVATEQPERFDRLFTTVAVTQNDVDRVVRLRKTGQLDTALDANVKARQTLGEEALRFRLR